MKDYTLTLAANVMHKDMIVYAKSDMIAGYKFESDPNATWDEFEADMTIQVMERAAKYYELADAYSRKHTGKEIDAAKGLCDAINDVLAICNGVYDKAAKASGLTDDTLANLAAWKVINLANSMR